MILMIDNYDSFTYNLVQLTGSINPDIRVIRNDDLTVREIAELHPTHLIISPGPGYPGDAGVCEEAIYSLGGNLPILGVCLGHQAICEVYGARISPANRLMHGKQSRISLDTGCELFKRLPPFIQAARYHSLAAQKETVNIPLRVIAEDELGEIMAVKHHEFQVYGVQFHPESILTTLGHVILENFLKL